MIPLERDSYLIGVGRYLPERIVGNDFFEGKPLKKFDAQGNIQKIVPCTAAWIQENMGIETRRYADDNETAHSMGAAAVAMALDNAGISASHLNGILAATVTSQRRFPSTSCEIQRLLDISPPTEREFFSCDLGVACAGYVTGMHVAHRLLQGGDYHALAVVGVEKLSSITDFEDANAPLFGDGAGAGIMVSSQYARNHFSLEGHLAGRIAATYHASDSIGENSMAIFLDDDSKLRMPEGNKVMKFATRSMTVAVKKIKEKTGWTHDDLTLVIPHQANIRILHAVARASELPLNKVYINIHRYGNMSSATCAVALSEALQQERIEEGSKVILTAFGSGYVTSAIGLEYCLL